MNKQFLKENKWTLLVVTLNAIGVLYGTKMLVESNEELKGGK